MKLGLRTKAFHRVSLERENSVCDGALHVIGLYGPGDKISLSLPGGLGADTGGIEWSHCPGYVVPGKA